MNTIIKFALIAIVIYIALKIRFVRNFLEKYWHWIVTVLLAYYVGTYIFTHEPVTTVVILVISFFVAVGLRWDMLSIPVIFILYSGYFGNFVNLPRLNILVGGLNFPELIFLSYLVFFLLKEKSKILRTPITKVVALLLISSIVSIMFTHLNRDISWHNLLMTQRPILLYLSVFIFLGVMKSNKSFHQANYVFLSIASIFILPNLLAPLFPDIQELRAFSIGGVSSYTEVSAIESFGARRFLLPTDGMVYCGLSFFFFLVTLKPFKEFRVWSYILCLLAFMTLLLSFTRGYWFCITLSIIVVISYISTTHQLHSLKFSRLFIVLCSAIIAITVFLSVRPDLYNALAARTWEMKEDLIKVTGTWGGRLVEAKFAMSVIGKNPIFGGGKFLSGAHFGFVTVYLNCGLLGFISFLLFLFVPIKQFVQNAHKMSDKTDFWIATSSIGYVLMFMTVSFYSSQFFHSIWVLSFCFTLANLAFLERKYKGNGKRLNAISVRGI